MTGLDKMINQILDEANSSAEKILEDARTSAEKIMDEAREEVKNMQKDSEKKTEAEIRNYKDRVISSSDLRRRTSLLEAKQELITAVVDRAYAVEKFFSHSVTWNRCLRVLSRKSRRSRHLWAVC